MKNQYSGENCLKMGLWTVCRFNGGGGGLGEKEGCGVDTPMYTTVQASD